MPPSLARSVLTGWRISGCQACRWQRVAPVPALFQSRHASGAPKKKAKDDNKPAERLSSDKRQKLEQAKKAKKVRADKQQWKRDPIEKGIFFPLIDAMRYIRAFEVGYPGNTTKYDLAINLKTDRSGATVKSGVKLPHPVDSAVRIAVICPPGSSAAKDAIAAGASLAGEDVIFEAVKAGNIEFERCLCHTGSLLKLQKSNLGRYLGPKGLMPSPKTGTVIKDVRAAIKNLIGGTQFRERVGTIRAPVGRLSYSPDQLQENIKALMKVVAQQVETMNAKGAKTIHDVVLSSTHSPGFPLSGMLMDENSPNPDDLKERSLDA